MAGIDNIDNKTVSRVNVPKHAKLGPEKNTRYPPNHVIERPGVKLIAHETPRQRMATAFRPQQIGEATSRAIVTDVFFQESRSHDSIPYLGPQL